MCRPCLRSLLLCLALYLSSLTNANGDPATVSIIEFMAANSRTLLDEDGDHSDWIELFNSGPVTTSMDGWFLTDDFSTLTKWRLPATNLAANAALVVFASGKDRAAPGARSGLAKPGRRTLVSDASYPCCSNGGYGYEDLRSNSPLAVDCRL